MLLRLLLIVVASVGMVVSNRGGLTVDDVYCYCCNVVMRFLVVGMRLLRQQALTIEQPASSITRTILSATAAWSLVLYVGENHVYYSSSKRVESLSEVGTVVGKK